MISASLIFFFKSTQTLFIALAYKSVYTFMRIFLTHSSTFSFMFLPDTFFFHPVESCWYSYHSINFASLLFSYFVENLILSQFIAPFNSIQPCNHIEWQRIMHINWLLITRAAHSTPANRIHDWASINSNFICSNSFSFVAFCTINK